MGQNTGTADGLFPDSEIAKQLVAQFVHNMLVKTSPWPQVCCENKITHQGCVNREQYHSIVRYVRKTACRYSNRHASMSIIKLFALKKMQTGQRVFLWRHMSFFISGVFSRRRDYHQITGMVSVF